MQHLHTPKQDKKPDQSAPHRVVWNACLLVDDFVHNRVEATAKKTEKKLGVTRKTLVYGSVIAGTVTTTALLASSPSPVAAPLVGIFAGLAFFVYKNILDKAMEFKISSSAVAEDQISFAYRLFLKIGRLPCIAAGLYKIAEGVLQRDIYDISGGTYAVGIAVAAYLVTSSTGMLDKAKASLAAARDKVISVLAPAPQPVPIPIRDP